MKPIIIHYSQLGRNEALAKSIASELSVENIKISEKKSRTNLTIILDLLLNRTPKINSITTKIKEPELIIFVGPVWFGKVAFPLRACLKELKNSSIKYVFISLSGGGDGANSNPNLSKELTERVGKKPLILMNFHVADLLPADPKPTPKDIDSYKVSKENVTEITQKVIKVLRPFIEN